MTNTLTPQELIKDCCEVNSSWAVDLGQSGVIAALDWDLCLEGSILADYVSEECNISEDAAVAELTRFICETRLPEPEWFIDYMPQALNIIMDEYNGDPEETVTALADYAERYECSEVMTALAEAAEGHDYEEELLEAIDAL